jgi:chromosome partitioning protein
MRNLIKGGLRRLAGTQPQRSVGNRHATIIAVSARKGGVGKTTTTVNLAAALGRFHDLKVLLVDLDPQCHVTTAIAAQVRPGGGGLSSVLLDESTDREVIDIACPTEIPNVWVTPVDRGMSNTEDLLGTRIGKEFILRDALRVTRTHFDVILLDCPPNLGNLTLNGLVAADQIVIPCDPSPLALSGVNDLIRTITTIATRLNPEIDVLGVLMTRVDGRNTALNEAVVSEIEAMYGHALLPVQIGTSTSLSKAQLAGQDIFGFDDGSRGAQHYRALAAHIVRTLSLR